MSELERENELKFLAWEKASRDTIDVKRSYIDVAGELVAGILLSQIVYWFLPNDKGEDRTTIKREGVRWLAKARGEWWDEIRISAKQFDRAASVLEEKGIIITEVKKFNGTPVKQIALKINTLVKAMENTVGAKWTSTKGQSGLLPKGNSDFDQRAKSYKEAETTTETTAERNIPEVGGTLFGEKEIIHSPKPSQEQVIEEEIRKTFDAYIHTFNRDPKRYIPTDSRMKLAKERLAERLKVHGGLAPAINDLLYAMNRCFESDFHMGRDPQTNGKTYNEWENIYREEPFYKFLSREPKGVSAPARVQREQLAPSVEGFLKYNQLDLLKRFGYTAEKFRKLGYEAADLRKIGANDETLRKLGFVL